MKLILFYLFAYTTFSNQLNFFQLKKRNKVQKNKLKNLVNEYHCLSKQFCTQTK